VHDEAAVHVDRLTGHLPGALRGQEYDHGRDILGGLPTTQRRAGSSGSDGLAAAGVRITVQQVDPELEMVSSDPAATSQRRRVTAPLATHLPMGRATMTDARPKACLHRIPYRGIGLEPTTRHPLT
jgi:hypothetical protein